jgi:YD repeat-containing protein
LHRRRQPQQHLRRRSAQSLTYGYNDIGNLLSVTDRIASSTANYTCPATCG